jgi:hypothetical protein
MGNKKKKNFFLSKKYRLCKGEKHLVQLGQMNKNEENELNIKMQDSLKLQTLIRKYTYKTFEVFCTFWKNFVHDSILLYIGLKHGTDTKFKCLSNKSLNKIYWPATVPDLHTSGISHK